MLPGRCYKIIVANGHAYSNDQCGIWIDWNQDLNLDDPGGAIPVSDSPGKGSYTTTITVPADATGKFEENIKRLKNT